MPSGQAKLLGIDVIATHTTQKHEMGIKITAADGRAYMYVQSNAAAIALGDCLVFDFATANYAVKTTPATADAPINGCWPNEGGRAALAAVTTFFWMLTGGDASVKAAATVVVGASIATIATAGTVDDTAASAANALSAASGISGTFVTTTTSGFARVMFNGF